MSEKKQKVLTSLINQFSTKHGSLPDKIVVEPLALVALSLKNSAAPIWQGIRVECREIEESEVVKPGNGKSLGVMLDTKETQIVACDLL